MIDIIYIENNFPDVYSKHLYIKESIRKNFAILLEKGFSLVEEKVNESQLLKFWITYNLVNKSKSRRIDIGYFPFNKEGTPEDSVNSDLIQEPYKGPLNFFSPYLFLAATQKE